MDLARIVPYVGALSCLVLAIVLSAPYLLVNSEAMLLGSYYGAGPVGIAGAVFLSLLGVVIFLSGERGQADPELIAGIMAVVGVVLFGMTVLWAVSITDTIVFSFPSEYSWIEYHPMLSAGMSAIVAVTGGLYAWAVLR